METLFATIGSWIGSSLGASAATAGTAGLTKAAALAALPEELSLAAGGLVTPSVSPGITGGLAGLINESPLIAGGLLGPVTQQGVGRFLGGTAGGIAGAALPRLLRGGQQGAGGPPLLGPPPAGPLPAKRNMNLQEFALSQKAGLPMTLEELLKRGLR